MGNCYNAQVRHRNASLSSRWRNDASQVISASDHDVLHDAQLPCLILHHLLEGFLHSVKSPFRGFHFSSGNALVFFPISNFQGDKALLHHSVGATSIIAAFSPLQILIGWRCQLPPTLHSCLRFFFSLLSEPHYSISFAWKKYSHFPRTYCSFPIFFQGLPRCAFCSANCLHCQFVSVVHLLPSEIRCKRFFSLHWHSSCCISFASFTQSCVSWDSTRIRFRFGLLISSPSSPGASLCLLDFFKLAPVHGDDHH